MTGSLKTFNINMKLIIWQCNVLCQKPLSDAIWKMCVGGKWRLLHIGRKGLVFILSVLLIASWISECYCGWNNDIAPLKMLTVMETVAMWCPEWIKNAWQTPFQLTLWFPGWFETSRCLIQPSPWFSLITTNVTLLHLTDLSVLWEKYTNLTFLEVA